MSNQIIFIKEITGGRVLETQTSHFGGLDSQPTSSIIHTKIFLSCESKKNQPLAVF